MALLQPPPEVYDLFDDILLLCEGDFSHSSTLTPNAEWSFCTGVTNTCLGANVLRGIVAWSSGCQGQAGLGSVSVFSSSIDRKRSMQSYSEA